MARVRFSPTGEFNDKAEGDVERDRRVRFAVGGAIARNEATMRPRSTTGLPYVLADSLHSYTHAAADVHFKWYGFSLLSQFFWRQADLRVDAAGGLSASRTGLVNGAPVTEYSRSALGYFVQAGGYVVDWLELVARYGELYPLGPTDPELRRQREVGGGFNLMLWKHDLKVACDVFWLDDGRGGDGRVQVRTQLQMYF